MGEIGREIVSSWQTQEQMKDGQGERRRLVKALINCLSSKRQKRVVRMHYGILAPREMSHEEIAETLDLSVAEVDDLYAKGMLELKRFALEIGNWVESERKASFGIPVTSRTRH